MGRKLISEFVFSVCVWCDKLVFDIGQYKWDKTDLMCPISSHSWFWAAIHAGSGQQSATPSPAAAAARWPASAAAPAAAAAPSPTTTSSAATYKCTATPIPPGTKATLTNVQVEVSHFTQTFAANSSEFFNLFTTLLSTNRLCSSPFSFSSSSSSRPSSNSSSSRWWCSLCTNSRLLRLSTLPWWVLSEVRTCHQNAGCAVICLQAHSSIWGCF